MLRSGALPSQTLRSSGGGRGCAPFAEGSVMPSTALRRGGAKQRHLPLLSIEAVQRLDNGFHHTNLPLRLHGRHLPLLNQARIYLLPQSHFPLGSSELVTECDHRPLSFSSARSRAARSSSHWSKSI